MVLDPVDYRFCGYAEAVAGGVEAQQGLLIATGQTDWTAAQADYRQLLFAPGPEGGNMARASMRSRWTR